MEHTEKANSDYINCCKRSFCKGQSVFARAFDAVLFNLLRFFTIYFILRQRLPNRTLCIFLAFILSAIVLCILKMVNKSRFTHHVEKLRKDTERELIKQKLILMESADYEAAVRTVFTGDCIILHSAEKVSPDSVYESVRLGTRRGDRALPIIGIEPFSDAAAQTAELLKEYEPRFISAQELPGIGDAIFISDNDVQKAIIRKYGKRKRKHVDFSAALAPDRAKKYFFTGLMLLLLSFVMSYGIYIRLFASIAFTAAGFVFFNDNLKKRQGSDTQ